MSSDVEIKTVSNGWIVTIQPRPGVNSAVHAFHDWEVMIEFLAGRTELDPTYE